MYIFSMNSDFAREIELFQNNFIVWWTKFTGAVSFNRSLKAGVGRERLRMKETVVERVTYRKRDNSER